MRALRQNARYSIRLLRKNPGFTLIAAITLALGIGANTAIFSVIYAVLMAPMPYPNPNQLVMVEDSGQQQRRFGGRLSRLEETEQDFLGY